MVKDDITTYNNTVVDEKEECCYIRFSLKWNKVHVHKSTVEMLNRPRYIQILINKDRKTLLIRGCDNKRPDSFRVPENLLLEAHAGFYLNSKLFTDMIINYLNWNREYAYRLAGKKMKDYNAVVFSLNDAERLNETT